VTKYELSGDSADHLLPNRRHDAIAKATKPSCENDVRYARQADHGEKSGDKPTKSQRPRVPVKDRPLGALFDRRAGELSNGVRRIVITNTDPRRQLRQLIGLHAAFASQMQPYFPFFFDAQQTPPELAAKCRQWHQWYEEKWCNVVAACVEAGCLPSSDPLTTTRLIMGMAFGAMQWNAFSMRGASADQVADSVASLIYTQRAPDAE
jgi:Tetracyclin repressor-like, C-terminal domain